MATYVELRSAFNTSDSLNKVTIAITIAADKVLDGGDDIDPPFSQIAGAHELRVAWAVTAMIDPESLAPRFWRAMLADNNTATLSAILGSTDAVIQTNVERAVDLFAGVAV